MKFHIEQRQSTDNNADCCNASYLDTPWETPWRRGWRVCCASTPPTANRRLPRVLCIVPCCQPRCVCVTRGRRSCSHTTLIYACVCVCVLLCVCVCTDVCMYACMCVCDNHQPFQLRAVRSQSRHAVFVQPGVGAVSAPDDGTVRVVALQEHAQRPPAAVGCTCPQSLLLAGAIRARLVACVCVTVVVCFFRARIRVDNT